jgi:hypothetical protein
MAEFLPGRTECAIKVMALKLGLGEKRRFSEADVAYVRAHAGEPVRAIAAALGRTMSSVHQLRNRLGLSAKRPQHGDEFAAFIREKHAEGWSDAETAAAYGAATGRAINRRTVGIWRRKLGLPDNAFSERRIRKVREKTREQLAAAGLPSLAAVRVKAFRDYARRYGWPEDLRPRQVQILNSLMARGPMTRPQIAEAIGMAWRGSRASLKGNDPEGSYLANLMKRGLVVQLGRVVKGKGRGHSINLYAVPLWTERNCDGQQTAQAG